MAAAAAIELYHFGSTESFTGGMGALWYPRCFVVEAPVRTDALGATIQFSNSAMATIIDVQLRDQFITSSKFVGWNFCHKLRKQGDCSAIEMTLEHYSTLGGPI